MTYETTDINLTGYLVASGMSLLSHRSDNGRTVFSLEQTDKLIQLVEDYYNMTAMINPLRYGSALKILKNIVYQKHHNYHDRQQIYNQSRKAR